jgi:hypothetical protein
MFGRSQRGSVFEEGLELRIRPRDLDSLSVDRGGREYILIGDEAYYVHSRDGLEIRTFPGAMWPQGKVYFLGLRGQVAALEKGAPTPSSSGTGWIPRAIARGAGRVCASFDRELR